MIYSLNFCYFTIFAISCFNFCKYIDKKCSSESPYYYAAAYNSTDCYYLNENMVNRTSYELIDTERDTGLKINYYDVRETGQVFQLNLICDQDTNDFHVLNTTFIDKTFQSYVKTKNICPQVLSTIIVDFFDTFKWIFFAIGLIVGPVELLLGNKIFKITVFLVR